MSVWTIKIPEEATPFKLPSSLTAPEAVEVMRDQNWVSSAYQYAVDEAALTITFSRPVGGDKAA